MRKLSLRLASLLLAAALLIGCVPGQASALSLLERLLSDMDEVKQEQTEFTVTPYSEMEYSRPDMDEVQAILDEVTELAQGRDSDAILEGVYAFYDAYDWVYTLSALADLRYDADLSDSHWEAESEFCTDAAGEVEQMLTSLYIALAASPCRSRLEADYFGDGFFDSYDTRESETDEYLQELTGEETELIGQYYSLVAESNSFFGSFFPPEKEMVQTLVELIRVRNEIAEYSGYDSYEQYANACLYARDYTPEQMEQYLDEIRSKLVPLYYDAFYDVEDWECSEEDTYEYVRELAGSIGGIVQDAFSLLDRAGLYDIAPGNDKINSSYEIYLPTYSEPFIFMNPDGSVLDKLTFAHEFGHFCNDYALGYASTNIDVAEIFSQALEYLSLIYTDEGSGLVQMKMVDSLCIYVEQACYAEFEREMYRIPDRRLSADALCRLYKDIATDYGLADGKDFNPMDFVYINHLYTSPMYVFSYIISNDAAMEIYHMELGMPGAGLECYLKNLDNPEGYFLAFLKSAGLGNPFEQGHVDSVAQMFRQELFGSSPRRRIA